MTDYGMISTLSPSAAARLAKRHLRDLDDGFLGVVRYTLKNIDIQTAPIAPALIYRVC